MTLSSDSAFQGRRPPSARSRAAVEAPVEASAASVPEAGDFVRLGVEEEFHVVDLTSGELVAQAPQLLERLPAQTYSDELHRSVAESNTPVCDRLEDLRDALTTTRGLLVDVAAREGLGVVAAGTVPLVDLLRLAVTPTARYERMLDDYQLLVREQLICGAQVHVQISDRNLAVRVAQRVTPYLPVFLALSASSPFWMGEDTGYASMRSLLWQRWPTAGLSGEIASAAEHDALVADLVASGTISDPGMIYFDVRPSAHLPTLELRVPDACPRIDDVVLLAGLFRALVRRERDADLAGAPPRRRPAPLLRSALWRAARSGLEGVLLDLPRSPRPVPAASAVRRLLTDLRPQLEDAGDWDVVAGLAEEALARGSAAAEQRAVYARRGRLTDVVDLLIRTTDPRRVPPARPQIGSRLDVVPRYRRRGDEALDPEGPEPGYAELLEVVERLGAPALRARERYRDEEQRSRGVTFGVGGGASERLFPVDLIPRIVPLKDWARLRAGLAQRATALDAFLHDVYGERAVVADGVIPAWVVEAAPGLRSVGAILRRQAVRAHVCGMDLVRDAAGTWYLLEDNLRVPSGLGYAVQNRRLSAAVMPDLPRPDGLLDVEEVPALLRATLESAALPAAPDTPTVVILSEGPESAAWFEHRMLGEEMGVPVAVSTEILVDDATVHLLRDGRRRAVDVLYLRIDEEALLHAAGADGRPLGSSLRAAVDAGRVALANAPGNGVGDDKAVCAFVARLVEYYLGEPALLGGVPTYLCADPDQRALVLSRLDRLVLKPVDGYGGEGVLIGPLAGEKEIAATRRQVLTAPHRWIAQEMVELSTHPTFDGDALVPRHVDLRAFVFHGDDLVVAPAALTRVAPAGSMVVNSSRGGGSKDTWLLG
jgi:glutamate---cysteine ligase / carboxylate-amine ligase